MIDTLACEVRWCVRRDRQAVLDMEAAHPHGLAEDDFEHLVQTREHVGIVAVVGGDVLGHCQYVLAEHAVHVLALSVGHAFRRYGVATQLLDRLKSRLDVSRRCRINVAVPESYLPGQLCLRANGFRCEQIIRDHFRGEDGYLFRWVKR